ncbi:MAG TPA: LysM peptidoglycan-binding domain-containing protein [Candidatus Saccharimonadales bacterium]|nr:LysM peptidoglycan-binding domain-containing protein [Candidatus Saccharimonadales bacterium]
MEDQTKIKLSRNKKTNDNKQEDSNLNIFDYLRFGESYTSLILGIIVVVIATGFILGFVHNRNLANKRSADDDMPIVSTQISQTNTETIISTVTNSPKNNPAKVNKAPTPTTKLIPTSTPTPKRVAKSFPTLTSRSVIIKSQKKITSPTPIKSTDTKYLSTKKLDSKMFDDNNKSPDNKKSYVVMQGDTLWSISEKLYKNGYRWVDIARANNLSNPDNIEVGQKISLTKIEQKKDTPDILSDGASTSIYSENSKITSSGYSIVQGDSLWVIALRAYGDGYRWVDIARANNLSNPDLIYPGDKLTIPRK